MSEAAWFLLSGTSAAAAASAGIIVGVIFVLQGGS